LGIGLKVERLVGEYQKEQFLSVTESEKGTYDNSHQRNYNSLVSPISKGLVKWHKEPLRPPKITERLVRINMINHSNSIRNSYLNLQRFKVLVLLNFIVSMSKTRGRDMSMYKVTEAMQNIQNDNMKLDYIKQISRS